MTKAFKPPRWLRNHHGQTCYPILTRPLRKQVRYQFESIPLPDGDVIEIARKGDPKAPSVLLMPGLEGGCFSPYIQSITKNLLPLGFQVIVMHYRSIGNGVNLNPKSYNAYDDQDLHAVLDYLKVTGVPIPRYAVGCSLGGNVLMHHLAKSQVTPFDAVMTISTPFDMVKTVRDIPMIYQKHFVKSMKKKMAEKIKSGIEMPASLEHLDNIETLSDFDDAFTAPLWGHRNAEHYYETGTNAHLLKDITTPTLMIFAEDDPFIPHDSVPTAEQLGDAVTLDKHTHGGHAGFVSAERINGSRLWLGPKVAASIKQFEANQSW
jgi:hypothetical protein